MNRELYNAFVGDYFFGIEGEEYKIEYITLVSAVIFANRVSGDRNLTIDFSSREDMDSFLLESTWSRSKYR